MFIRSITSEEKSSYNSVVLHPLQSWEWGEFKKKTGLIIERVGIFEKSKLVKALQVTFHPVPFLNKNVGYFPKGSMPDTIQLSVLKDLAKKNNAIFIKLEPNIAQKVGVQSAHKNITQFLFDNNCVPGKPLFTKYTFQLDLTRPEEILFKNLASKTRYNVNLAYKKGVRIFENTSAEGMNQYVEILKETTKRQGFYAHSPKYFQDMWDELGASGNMRIFNAVYEDKILTSWIIFIFNGVIYYPYGSSRSENRDVMANNLMMWEMIKFGKKEKCHTFDMWGSLGPEPDKKHSWYGFHKFKQGYGGDLVEFLGTYDYVIDMPMYKLFTIIDNIRWKILKLRTKLKI
ncbi:peptidoglycan bridge formation glycyltransferase FemA/FemB family protein [Candidatus Woesebacteria bacterium]|nr:peptidoglycan bridge formation glycyltransferase FemA/FemB family protein [Candidatus Woesebacteria bacterium]